MKKIKNIQWQLILDKAGTILGDRRFWVSLLTLVSVVFGVPQLAGDLDGLSEQAVGWVVIISQVMSMVLIPTGLIVSWSKRAPSGLRFKDSNVDVEDFITKLAELTSKDN